MKQIIITSLTQLTSNRRLLLTLLGLLLVSVGAIVYIAVTIESSDLRIITQYTAYGVTHFYRSSWLYLLLFIGFIVVNAIFAVGISLKLLAQEREPLAAAYGWVAISMVVTAVAVYLRIDGLI